MNESLTNAEIERFSRQLILPEFGIDGKKDKILLFFYFLKNPNPLSSNKTQRKKCADNRMRWPRLPGGALFGNIGFWQARLCGPRYGRFVQSASPDWSLRRGGWR